MGRGDKCQTFEKEGGGAAKQLPIYVPGFFSPHRSFQVGYERGCIKASRQVKTREAEMRLAL